MSTNASSGILHHRRPRTTAPVNKQTTATSTSSKRIHNQIWTSRIDCHGGESVVTSHSCTGSQLKSLILLKCLMGFSQAFPVACINNLPSIVCISKRKLCVSTAKLSPDNDPLLLSATASASLRYHESLRPGKLIHLCLSFHCTLFRKFYLILTFHRAFQGSWWWMIIMHEYGWIFLLQSTKAFIFTWNSPANGSCRFIVLS